MNKITTFLSGIAIGITNMLFGSGGGIIAVPILKKVGLTQKEAQANAIAVILPLTIITLIIYFKQGNVNLSEIKYLFPTAALGAIAGALIFKKLANNFLTVVFSLFMIWAGVRMLTK